MTFIKKKIIINQKLLLQKNIYKYLLYYFYEREVKNEKKSEKKV